MSLNVKDADGVKVAVKTTIVSTEHVPQHIIYSSALPTGASTSTKQDSLLAELQNKANLSDTQPVSVTGGSTATGQANIISAINNLETVASNILTATTNELTQPGHQDQVSGFTASITDTSVTEIIAAPAVDSGLALLITQLTISNDHATTGTYLNFKSGTTVIFTVYAPAKQTVPLTFVVPLTCSIEEAFSVVAETTASSYRVAAIGVSRLI